MEETNVVQSESTSLNLKEKHVNINVSGSSRKDLQTVDCESANITVYGASTLIIDKLKCSGDVIVNCSHASVIIIKELSCNTIKINHGYSSSMRIDNVFTCNNCEIDVHYSSRLDITKGSITNVSGKVTFTSFVRNVAKVNSLNVWVDKVANKAPSEDFLGSTYINW